MKLSIAAVELLLCLAAALGAQDDSEPPWKALERLPKHARYTVLKRDGTCVSGSLGSVSTEWLILNLDKHHPQSLSRKDVLRVSLGVTPDIHAAVYSGRSSWLDVRALQTPPAYADLQVATTDDREFIGRFLSASDDKLNIAVEGHELRFTKTFVSTVALRSAEPLDPDAHTRSKKTLPAKQPVPIYQVNTPEDNSRVDCPAYRRQ